MYCEKRNADKLQRLKESIIRFVIDDFINSHHKLLEEINQPSLKIRKINDMLTLVYLALNDAAPNHIYI